VIERTRGRPRSGWAEDARRLAETRDFGQSTSRVRVPVKFRGVTGLFLLEQSPAHDKQRLVKKLGAVPDAVLSQVLKTLRELYVE
jgi:mRNA-degrading endonuclease toxin of MazEF toxin-antitoxin module